MLKLFLVFLVTVTIYPSFAGQFFRDLGYDAETCDRYYENAIIVSRYQTDNMPAHIVELAVSVNEDCSIMQNTEKPPVYLFRRRWEGECGPTVGHVDRKAEIEIVSISTSEVDFLSPYFKYLLQEIAADSNFDFNPLVKVKVFRDEEGNCTARTESSLTYYNKTYDVSIDEVHACFERNKRNNGKEKTPAGVRISGILLDSNEDFVLWLGDHSGKYLISVLKQEDFQDPGINVGIK